jgi:hypothetical protein
MSENRGAAAALLWRRLAMSSAARHLQSTGLALGSPHGWAQRAVVGRRIGGGPLA